MVGRAGRGWTPAMAKKVYVRRIGTKGARARVPAPLGLMRAEGIADGDAKTGRVGGTEFQVVVHQVDTGFRPNEEIAPRIKPDGGAEMAEEMVAADVVGAGGKTANGEILIETDALRADAALQFELNLVGDRRRIDGVEIVENRPIRLAEEPLEITAAGAPGDFTTDTEMVEEKDIATECRIETAGQRLGKVVAGSARSRRGCEGVRTKSDIDLLRVSGALAQEKTTETEQGGCDQFSHVTLRSETLKLIPIPWTGTELLSHAACVPIRRQLKLPADLT